MGSELLQDGIGNVDLEGLVKGFKKAKFSTTLPEIQSVHDIIKHIDVGTAKKINDYLDNPEAAEKLLGHDFKDIRCKMEAHEKPIVEDKKMKAYGEAMVEWNSKSTVANAFRKEHVKGTPKGDAYHALNQKEALEFRINWAKTKYDEVKLTKVSTTSWSRVDRTKGRYRTFGKLVVDLGGWRCEDAVKGAIIACKKCAAMGAPWYKVHPQTEMLEFLVLESEFEEDFSKSWSQFKEEIQTQPNALPPPSTQQEGDFRCLSWKPSVFVILPGRVGGTLNKCYSIIHS